jgi:hypothetical protein
VLWSVTDLALSFHCPGNTSRTAATLVPPALDLTAVDFAHMLRDLSDTHFLKAKKIVLMEDNLSTHKPASLYKASAEARRLVERFE